MEIIKRKGEGMKRKLQKLIRRNWDNWETFREREESTNFYRDVELPRGKYNGGFWGLLLRLEGSENYILCHSYWEVELHVCPWSEGGCGGDCGSLGIVVFESWIRGRGVTVSFGERKTAGNWRRGARWVLFVAGRGWSIQCSLINLIDFNRVVISSSLVNIVRSDL